MGTAGTLGSNRSIYESFSNGQSIHQKSHSKTIMKAYSTDSTCLIRKQRKDDTKRHINKKLSNSESLLNENYSPVIFFLHLYLIFKESKNLSEESKIKIETIPTMTHAEINSPQIDILIPSFSNNFNSLYSQRIALRSSVSTASSSSDDETRYISRDPACVLYITETGKKRTLPHNTVEESSGSSAEGNSDIERHDIQDTYTAQRRNPSETGYFS